MFSSHHQTQSLSVYPDALDSITASTNSLEFLFNKYWSLCYKAIVAKPLTECIPPFDVDVKTLLENEHWSFLFFFQQSEHRLKFLWETVTRADWLPASFLLRRYAERNVSPGPPQPRRQQLPVTRGLYNFLYTQRAPPVLSSVAVQQWLATSNCQAAVPPSTEKLLHCEWQSKNI